MTTKKTDKRITVRYGENLQYTTTLSIAQLKDGFEKEQADARRLRNVEMELRNAQALIEQYRKDLLEAKALYEGFRRATVELIPELVRATMPATFYTLTKRS